MGNDYCGNAALNHSDYTSIHLELIHQPHIPSVFLQDLNRFENFHDFQEPEQSGQAHQPQQLLIRSLLLAEHNFIGCLLEQLEGEGCNKIGHKPGPHVGRRYYFEVLLHEAILLLVGREEIDEDVHEEEAVDDPIEDEQSNGLLVYESYPVRHVDGRVEEEHNVDDIPVGLDLATHLDHKLVRLKLHLDVLQFLREAKKVDFPTQVLIEVQDEGASLAL